mgnify:CR=1 FL=1
MGIKQIAQISFLKNYFTKGHERSIRAKKNIAATIVIKGFSIVISLVFVPLVLNYVNSAQYGIWLTLSSIVGWFSFFDIGLTQGLRNKFAEALARGDHNAAQIFVSTTYAILGIVFFGVWLLFLIVNNFLDWSSILKVPKEMQSEVSILAMMVFTYFCIAFVLRIITTIFLADQKPAKSSLIDLLGQIASLTFIFILVKTTEGSLIRLGIALCVSPVIVLLAANLVSFSGTYKVYRPTFAQVNFAHAKSLINLGVKFFIIQVAGIIQFHTANIIIARNFGTDDVTAYNIVYKYFGVLNMVNTIFIAPFWSASTEAYLKNDIAWIRNGIRKYNLLNILLFVAGLLMLIFSGTVYRLWLGEGKVLIPFSLSLWGFIYFNVILYGTKYVSFLNGINALKIQFIASTISPVLYLIVAISLIKYSNMGVYALFVASVVANFNAIILAPLQYYFIINKQKKGIWAA